MKKFSRFYQNIPFVISFGAYCLLAVPATKTGLMIGFLLVVGCYLLGMFLPSTWHYMKKVSGKAHWIASAIVCLLMGLRFDNVWKLSGLVNAVADRLAVDTVTMLSAIGCILAVCALFFTVTALTFLLKEPAHLLNDSEDAAARQPLKCSFCVGIAVVLVLQLAMLCYWGAQKHGFHVDEVYTFELSNYPDTIYGDSENAYASWKTGDTFRQVLEPADGRLFDLSVPFWNGETDNHPPTYYILVNIVSSVFKLLGIRVNKWAGLLPNIACSLVTTYFIIRLLYRLFGNDLLALVGAFVWTFFIGTINTGVYLRMYALLTLAVVIFCWLQLNFLANYSQKQSVGNTLALLQLTTIFGILSQYYFLFFAFFFCGFMCVYLFIRKDWAMLRCYMLTEIGAVAAAELLFPRMVVRLFFGDRGSEALGNLVDGSGYISQLKAVLEIINRELFGGYGLAVLAVSIVCLLISAVLCNSRKQKPFPSGQYVTLLLLTSVFYILAVTKIAPYQVDRYFMCIFPLVSICAVYGLYCCALAISTALPKNTRACTITAAVVLAVFTLSNTASGDISYIYSDGAERAAVLSQYKELPVIALNGDEYNDSVLQWAFEFQNYEDVFLCNNNGFSDLNLVSQDRRLKNGFLLYVHQEQMEAEDLFARICEYLDVDSYTEITDIQQCRVFYCTIKGVS